MTKMFSSQRFARQLGIVNHDKLQMLHVTIIGCGATGSILGVLLAKMGVGGISLWDGDTIEEHNLPNQFFRESDLGKNKAMALKEVLESFGGQDVRAVDGNFVPSSHVVSGEIVILAVDSMKVRKEIWEKSIKNKFGAKLFIDPRVGAESFRIYALRPTDTRAQVAYEETLYTDEGAAQVPCTERSIMYTVSLMASVMGKYVRNYVMGETNPFEFMGDLNNFYFISEMDPVSNAEAEAKVGLKEGSDVSCSVQ